MGQTWYDLLFAHWTVPLGALRSVVPPQLPIDLYEGEAWLGVTPFVVRGMRLQGTVPVPRLSSFPELNVRTYVTVAGRPGIYFLSLDAARRLAVMGARRSHRLPYFRARMTARRTGTHLRYSSRRLSGDGPPAAFSAVYGPTGPLPANVPGSLERWLCERYCLYVVDEPGRVLTADIHHPPWPLQPAEADITANTMASPFGIELDGPPLLHFSRRQDTLIWRLVPVRGD